MRHSSLEEETMIKYIALLVVILLYFNTLADLEGGGGLWG